MRDSPTPIDVALKESESQLIFLTPTECAGGWTKYFGEAARRVPEPNWLYADDEQRALLLGFPMRVSPGWDRIKRDIARLVDAEVAFRRNLNNQDNTTKANLIEMRKQAIKRFADLYENAFLNDYGQRLPEVLWLVLTNEISERICAVIKESNETVTQLPARALDEMRYQVAERMTDIIHRAEAETLSRLRQSEGLEPPAASRTFLRLLCEDLLPLTEVQLSRDYRQINSYLHGRLKIDAVRFHRLCRETTEQLSDLRQRDKSFETAIAILDPEIPTLPVERWVFNANVLTLVEGWSHPATPKLSTEMRQLLIDLSACCKRFEVISVLRRRIYPIEERGSTVTTPSRGQPLRLSGSTRPLDFTMNGVLPSMVRRYGLVYDLVEFTQILEELRRQGRNSEEGALRQMERFLRQIDEIRARHRMKFEKFLGDGAFYSSRSARATIFVAAELRDLYESLRHKGFPFDRGLRMAMNVGTYHLLPMVSPTADRPSFEFFGHGLVELARLTTGKRTQEVEDIADFLLSSGYDMHRVMSFLEPVRHSSRVPDKIRERPYAAFIAENGELVNLGSVVTEAFLHDLDAEISDLRMHELHRFGGRWLLLPASDTPDTGLFVGLRFLGTAKLKGLDPVPLAEVVSFSDTGAETTPLPEGTPLLQSLLRMAGVESEIPAEGQIPSIDIDPRLCVVSVLEDGGAPSWTIGQYSDENDVLEHAFRIRLTPTGLRDGEPFEAWLFQRRGELAMLYQGLRRDSTGATVPLETLRGRDGYFSCLLIAPQRSPR